MTSPASSALKIVESFPITSRVTLLLARGSVLDFVPRHRNLPSAIVNAANPGCLGGGGVDGAITDAGGPNLAADRRKLPVLSQDGVRCFTGNAVRTGPNRYGELLTPYVIHAVGPNYNDFVSCFDDDYPYYNDDDPASSQLRDDNVADDQNAGLVSSRLDEGHKLLRSAYQSSLDLALEVQCQQVAFSLLSAGVYRGPVPLHRIFEITAASIQEWAYRHLDDKSPAAPGNRKSAAAAANANANRSPASSSPHSSRRPPVEVILCAYSPAECQTLVDACRGVFEA